MHSDVREEGLREVQPEIPDHPKGHGKVGKPTDQIRQDEQWSYSCRLASSRGKAMAILIDEKGEYSDIDEVLVIVGPSLDILIRFDIEDGEVSREVFVENYVQHVEGRYGKRGNTMCITVPVEERDKRFILDSGSGHDLISSTRISRMDLPTYDDKVVNFHTANGVTCSTKRSSIKFEAFNEPAEAHILEDTPSVISMGKRCVDLGYSFVWPTGKNSFHVRPQWQHHRNDCQRLHSLCECRSREEKAKIILRGKDHGSS